MTEIPVDERGIIDLQALEQAAKSAAKYQQIPGEISHETYRHGVRLLSIMTANNEIGTIQPMDEIEAIAREHGFTRMRYRLQVISRWTSGSDPGYTCFQPADINLADRKGSVFYT